MKDLLIKSIKNGVKATYVPLFATMRGNHNTCAAAFLTITK